MRAWQVEINHDYINLIGPKLFESFINCANAIYPERRTDKIWVVRTRRSGP
jgi:hypothetical protein